MEAQIEVGWNTTMFVGYGAKDSHSAMSRLNSRMGIRRTCASTSCAYIILSKIKRALKDAAEVSEERMRITYDRLTSKLERLSLLELEYIHFLLLTVPFDEMVAKLRVKATLIRKEAAKWHKTMEIPDEEIFESEDPTENVLHMSEEIGPEELPDDV